MNKDIHIDLVKLVGGERLLRFSEPAAGLCLEKKLDPREPVTRQKERWLRAFEGILAREGLAPA
jgi:hypothetical protein